MGSEDTLTKAQRSRGTIDSQDLGRKELTGATLKMEAPCHIRFLLGIKRLHYHVHRKTLR
jgi:hypothetical protein